MTIRRVARAAGAGLLTTALAFAALPATHAATATASFPEFPDGVTRLAGTSRYETAVAVAKRYEPGVPAVFVATGETFPDALSAAAAAALAGGPLLLTPTASLPDAVKAEITRLAPKLIIVAGGKSAVSNNVVDALGAIAETRRLGGADRYATSTAMVAQVFDTATEVFIATGASYPDALAATGAAGSRRAPVILVDGAQSALPAGTLGLLEALGAAKVTIAGGTGAVSPGIATQLADRGFTVKRLGGADRYATAALINLAHFAAGSTNTLFLATGNDFPDALSGAALAGLMGVPLFITKPGCTPQAIHAAINTLGAPKRVVMGGKQAVSDAAAANAPCVTAPTPSPTPTPEPSETSSPSPTPSPSPSPPEPLTCASFGTQANAQAFYDLFGPSFPGMANLGELDVAGKICTSLP